MESLLPTGRYWHARRAKVAAFFPDDLLQPRSVKILVFKTKIEILCGNWLVTRTTEGSEEWMRQGFFNCDALFWMDLKHLS